MSCRRRPSRPGSGSRPAARSCRSRSFAAKRVAVLVKESVAGPARERFERSVRQKIEGLGSTIVDIVYVEDDPTAVRAALRPFVRGPEAVDLVLTAGGASTDPEDPFFVALRATWAGAWCGRACRRIRGRCSGWAGPAGPRSWACRRAAPTPVRRPPTCSSRACWPASPPTAATVAKLGHGGVLGREMRFRFPAYALELEAPEG